MSRQITQHILMIRPAHFGFNPETAADNAFQKRERDLSPETIAHKARQEFDAMVERLRSAGVDVLVVEDNPSPLKPDAVFPNNWVSFHADGRVITYPMMAPTRRLERREEVLQEVGRRFHIRERLHLEPFEEAGKFLEGTGSLVLDRVHRLAYACLSERTHPEVLERFCALTGYTAVPFHGADTADRPIYHTNVMMALGETFAVICLDAIASEKEKAAVEERLQSSGKEIIPITQEQMGAFAGNMLQVLGAGSAPLTVLSQTALRSLEPAQIATLDRHNPLLPCPIPVIETSGGGSVRCMMAEIFLPPKESS